MVKPVQWRKIFKQDGDLRGITLIEIIIAVAIALMVLTVSFSVFSFGNNAFRKGVSQYDVQSDVRLASDYVQNQVRYATFIKLIDSPTFNEYQDYDEGDPAELMAIKQNLEYIYFDESNRLNHVIYNHVSNAFDKVRFQSTFTLPGSHIVAHQQMLQVSVDANDRQADYQLISEIILPNMQLANVAIQTDGSKGILFSKNTQLAGLISGTPSSGGSGGGSDDDGEEEEDSPFQTISLALIGGLAKPVHNATPVTSFQTDQYTATVSWNPNPFDDSGKFKKNTSYTATVIIIPKTGYTVNGLSQNYFTVTGATSTTNSPNSNTIVAIFHPE